MSNYYRRSILIFPRGCERETGKRGWSSRRNSGDTPLTSRAMDLIPHFSLTRFLIFHSFVFRSSPDIYSRAAYRPFEFRPVILPISLFFLYFVFSLLSLRYAPLRRSFRRLVVDSNTRSNFSTFRRPCSFPAGPFFSPCSRPFHIHAPGLSPRPTRVFASTRETSDAF